MVIDTERLTLSVHETAKALGISVNSCYLGIKTGQIPSIKIGSRLLVPKAQILKMLSGNGEVSHD